MGRMSDIIFYYENDSAPLRLYAREQHNYRLQKNILANQLVSPADMKESPASVNISHQCKIGESSTSHDKIKKKHSKDNSFKVKK